MEEASAPAGDDRGARLFRVCAWNAFAFQTIAEKLIEADAAEDPGTAGYVPRATLRFASACLDRVPDWIRLARVVQSDPTARVRGLPATLPEWLTDESTRITELHGLRAAFDALEVRVEGALASLPLGRLPPQTSAECTPTWRTPLTTPPRSRARRGRHRPR